MHTLKVRLLKERYGKLFESSSITKEDLSRLVSEISLPTESLRKLCNWIKACGIKIPGLEVSLQTLTKSPQYFLKYN